MFQPKNATHTSTSIEHWVWWPAVPFSFPMIWVSLQYCSRSHILAGLFVCLFFVFFVFFCFAQEIGTTVHKLLLRMISKSDVNEVRDERNCRVDQNGITKRPRESKRNYETAAQSELWNGHVNRNETRKPAAWSELRNGRVNRNATMKPLCESNRTMKSRDEAKRYKAGDRLTPGSITKKQHARYRATASLTCRHRASEWSTNQRTNHHLAIVER